MTIGDILANPERIEELRTPIQVYSDEHCYDILSDLIEKHPIMPSKTQAIVDSVS